MIIIYSQRFQYLGIILHKEVSIEFMKFFNQFFAETNNCIFRVLFAQPLMDSKSEEGRVIVEKVNFLLDN